jgi:hypothetical protein
MLSDSLMLAQLFQFADKYRGKYDSSITVARNYYGSFSGYGVSNFVTSDGDW